MIIPDVKTPQPFKSPGQIGDTALNNIKNERNA